MEKQNLPQGQRPTTKIELLKGIINAPSVQEQFNNTLKENSGAFLASVIELFNGDTYLQECDPKTIVNEALKAATLKLPINKQLGFAYIVPYKTRGVSIPQFQIGYKGYIQLAMRTGQYRFLNADVVYEGELKRRDKLTGEIDFSGDRTSDKIVGYFAHLEMLNGFTKTLYSEKEKVIAHAKKYSKSYNSDNSAWKTNFDEMAIKTVVRGLLSHWGYLSVEMIAAMNADNDDVSERNEAISQASNSKEFPADEVAFEDVKSSPKQQAQAPKPDQQTEAKQQATQTQQPTLEF